MKIPKSEQREKYIGLLLIALSFSMIIVAVVSFMLGLKEQVDGRTNYMINDAVQQYSKSFAASINAKLTTAVTVSDVLSTLEKNDLQQVRSIIEKVVYSEKFHFLAVTDIYGNTVASGGNNNNNLLKQEYLKRVLKGETMIEYAKGPSGSSENILLLFVPIYVDDDITGVLSCGYELSKLEQLTQNPTYFGEAYMTVYSGDYEVISWQQHKNAPTGGSDLVKILENGKMFGGMSSDQLRTNMKSHMGGSFSVEYMGEKRLVSYAPLGINNWYAFCYAPFTVYNNETVGVSRIVILLIGELAVSVGFILLYVLRINRRHSKMIGAANIKYEAIISNICGGVTVTASADNIEDVTLVYVSSGFTEMTGYTYEDIMLQCGGLVSQVICDKDLPTINRTLKNIGIDHREYDMEYRIICKDGHTIWVLDKGKLIENEEGMRQFQSVLTDISVIKAQRDQLAISEERFRIAIESADNIMFDYDSVNCVYVDFSNAERMLGKTCQQINNDLEYTRTLDETARTIEISKYFYHPDDLTYIMEQSRISLETGEVYFDARVRIVSGAYIWCSVHLTIIKDEDGAPFRVLGFMGNIDAVKRQAELFRVRSEKDGLTGFYNKAATISLVNDALGKDNGIPYTMLVMDIDNFKSINDTMGHIAGDTVISQVAERIRAIFRSDDILGRVGGDEFVVLIRGVEDREHIIRKSNEITKAFADMLVNGQKLLDVSVSIGIEVCTQRSSYEEIFIRADKALYQAKRAGKNRYVFYDTSFRNSSCYTCNDIGGAQGR